MKIAICNPPLKGPGVPLLSQNRQFQWFRSPLSSYVIYPVIPASAATLLKSKGYRVFWLDYVAEKRTYKEFADQIDKQSIDLIAIESKTPVIQQHWQIINNLKKRFPKIICILMGDHVTALPAESFEKSKVDYVICGGDYDFLLLNIIEFLNKKKKVLEPGIYFKDVKGRIKNAIQRRIVHDLNKLPLIDRKLTKWELYSVGNGNFKYTPNTYTMAGRDCWWRRNSLQGGVGCTFCSWTTLFSDWRVVKPERLLDEVGYLTGLGIKEIFDDTGTFPIGAWLKKFCQGMVRRGYNKKIFFGCNMRAGALVEKDFQLMKKAGFRFILYGLESVNQRTLDRLNKGTTAKVLENSLKMAKQAGLEPHVTVMFGYPWETKEEVKKTVEFTHSLFEKGYIDTLQATLLIPYPGTALYKEAVRNNWLKTSNYERFDMSEPILKTRLTGAELKKAIRNCYNSFWSVGFMKRKIFSIRNVQDVKFLVFLAVKYLSKLLDFQPKKNEN